MQDQTGNNDLHLDRLSEELAVYELTNEDLEWVNGAGDGKAHDDGYSSYPLGVQYGDNYFGVDIGFGGR